MKKMTRDEAIGLYNTISQLKSGKLSREAQIVYIPLRVKLKEVAAEFEKIREEAIDQNKPENFDDLSSDEQAQKELSEKVLPILQDWAKQSCDIETKIFTIEDAVDLIQSNPDLSGAIGDVIVEYFVK